MLALELREKLFAFIQQEINLPDLEEWMAPRLPELIQDPASQEAALVAAVELCLAEFSEGIRDEDDARRYLRQALADHPTIYVSYAVDMSQTHQTTSSASVTVTGFTVAGHPSRVIALGPG